MPRLNLSQPPLHLVAIFQPAKLDRLLQAVQGFFHTAAKTISDSLLFFFAARRAAQNVSLLALRKGYLLHFHGGPNLRPVLFQQFPFKLLHLAARRAHQILSVAFADRCQILLAHDSPIQHPDPSRLAVLALDHAQHRLHRRDVGAIAVEGFVAERKTLTVDDERDHHLLAVRTMIPRIAAAHQRLLSAAPSTYVLVRSYSST